jgi:hypothetical protein
MHPDRSVSEKAQWYHTLSLLGGAHSFFSFFGPGAKSENLISKNLKRTRNPPKKAKI